MIMTHNQQSDNQGTPTNDGARNNEPTNDELNNDLSNLEDTRAGEEGTTTPPEEEEVEEVEDVEDVRTVAAHYTDRTAPSIQHYRQLPGYAHVGTPSVRSELPEENSDGVPTGHTALTGPMLATPEMTVYENLLVQWFAGIVAYNERPPEEIERVLSELDPVEMHNTILALDTRYVEDFYVGFLPIAVRVLLAGGPINQHILNIITRAEIRHNGVPVGLHTALYRLDNPEQVQTIVRMVLERYLHTPDLMTGLLERDEFEMNAFHYMMRLGLPDVFEAIAQVAPDLAAGLINDLRLFEIAVLYGRTHEVALYRNVAREQFEITAGQARGLQAYQNVEAILHELFTEQVRAFILNAYFMMRIGITQRAFEDHIITEAQRVIADALIFGIAPNYAVQILQQGTRPDVGGNHAALGIIAALIADVTGVQIAPPNADDPDNNDESESYVVPVEGDGTHGLVLPPVTEAHPATTGAEANAAQQGETPPADTPEAFRATVEIALGVLVIGCSIQ